MYDPSVEAVDALAQLREVARDPRIGRLEHREPLEHVERAYEIALPVVDAGEIDQHAGEDLTLAGRRDHARLEHRIGRRGLPEQRLEISRRERAAARVRIEEQPRVL